MRIQSSATVGFNYSLSLSLSISRQIFGRKYLECDTIVYRYIVGGIFKFFFFFGLEKIYETLFLRQVTKE